MANQLKSGIVLFMILSVIIPTYNRADALDLTLGKLMKQLFAEEWEVIVVNNNCTDNTDEVVKKHQQSFPVSLQLIYENKPGAAAARNAGARKANGDFLVFIDNDILTEPSFLASHLRILHENPRCWVVGAIANLPEQAKSPLGQFRKSLALPETSFQMRESLIFTGANCSMPRRDFERLGGFDEGFDIGSGEDQEFAMRARAQLGTKTLYSPSIVGVHNDWAGWTFADFCHRQQTYASTEFYFWSKYGDEHPRLQMLKESLPINWREDSLNLKIRKGRKNILGSRIVQKILLNGSNLIEKSSMLRPLLWKFYQWRLAGAINNGLCEGRKCYLSKN